MTPVLTELRAGGGAGCWVALMAGLGPAAGLLPGAVTTFPLLKSRWEVVVVVVVVVVVAGDGVTATGTGLGLLGAGLGRAPGGFGKGSLQALAAESTTAAAI